MSKIKIKNEEIAELLVGEAQTFPKYSTQLLNLVNQNAQGTRPYVVGQMSELIQRYPGKDFKGWEKWYIKQQPNAIKDATEKVYAKLLEMRTAMNNINKALVERWVKDLVITKTFTGLRFQEAILKKIAELKNKPYRLSTPAEEAKGIDGFIGDEPISIKPATYKIESALREHIEVRIVYYEKKKDGIIVIL